MPDPGLVQEQFFSLDDMKRIIEAAKEPYETYYRILAETGFAPNVSVERLLRRARLG